MLAGLSFTALLAMNGLAKSYMTAHQIKQTNYSIITQKVKRPYKILFVSDIHYGAWNHNAPECPTSTEMLNKVLANRFSAGKLDINVKRLYDSMFEKFNSVNADVVLLGGDVVTYCTTLNQMKRIFTDIGNIPNKYGIYYVEGNHDSESPLYSYDECIDFMQRCGVTPLLDDSTWVNEDLNICGRRDVSHGRKEAYKLISRHDTDWYTIVVDHTPADYYRTLSENTDLMLSGHTHAGQVFPINFLLDAKCLPRYGAYHIEHGYVTNGIRQGESNLIVSSGIGTGGYPLRNLGLCEYVVLDLIPEGVDCCGETLHDNGC